MKDIIINFDVFYWPSSGVIAWMSLASVIVSFRVRYTCRFKLDMLEYMLVSVSAYNMCNLVKC